MSLREDLLKSNGVTSTGSSSQAPAPSSALRSKLLADNKINTATTGPTGPAPTTNRDALLSKNKVGQYASTTGPTGPAPVVPPVVPKPGLAGDTQIASPEYFSKSVDVISPKGKFVATFTGNDAYEQAKVKADEVGGVTKVTPVGGFVGRAVNKVKDAVTGAVNDFADKTVQAFGLNDERLNLETGKRSPARNDVQVGADALRAGIAGVNMVFSPISGLFSAAEEVPVLKYPAQGINYLFGKLGEAGNWAGDKVVDTLPVSDATKETLKPAAEELGALLAQIAAGKLGEKGLKVAKVRTEDLRNQIKENITKDVVTTHNLPATVYIDGEKIRSIFQRGDKISPEELDLVKSLGLDGTGYKNAINNGLSIAVPSEKIVTITDKPWFAKVKSAIGMEPTKEVTTTKAAEPAIAPRALLEEPSMAPKIVDPNAPAPTTNLAEKTTITRISDPVPANVDAIAKEPITSKTFDTINAFTPEEFSAFGRKIVDGLNQEAGTKITDTQARKAGLPDAIDVLESNSPDGRPAQFKQGKIQVFLPDLVRDIKALAEGKKILAHGGENAKVYQMKPGESFEDLSLRYTKDVLVHELSHEKTVSLEDNTKAAQLRQEIIKARQSGDQKKIIEANTNMQKFMEELETKALNYERANRQALENEIFSKEKTSTQRKIDRSVAPAPAKKITTSESVLLKERIKNQAAGARAGKEAGKEEKQKELDVAKKGFGETLTKLKDKEATLQQKRHALVEYAEAFLPVAERGKFLRVIRYPGSDKNFFDILGRMQAAAKSVERKAIISEISTELKGAKVQVKDKKPNAKFEYEAQKKLDRIRANVNSDYSAAQQKIVDLISEFQAANPDSVLPSDILSEIQELKMVGIKDMTVEELRTTLADIKSIKETGRTLKDLERFNRDTAIQQVKDRTIETLTGGLKNPKADQGLRRPEDKPTSFEKVQDFFTLQQAGFEEILDSMSRFDKGTDPYKSFLNEHFTKKTSESFAKQDEGEIAQVGKVNEMIKEAYGFKKDGELYKYLNDMHEKVKLDDVTMADGSTKQIQITKGEALQMYMWSKDETLHDTFTQGLNWGEDAQKRVFDLLSDKDKALADKLLGFYREYYKGINEVFQKEYGVDLPFNENYSPVARNVETSIPENVMLAQEMKSYATAKNNSLKSRVQNNIDLKPKDAFQNMVSHINMMEHYKAWSETMYEARRVFGDKEVRQTIDDYHGRKYLKEVDSFLNDFARDGVDRAKIVPIVDKLRANTSKAILGLNPSVAIKQLTGLSNYLIEIPAGDFFTGVTNFWSSPLTKAKFLQENSPVLRERFGDGYERDIKHALSTDYAKKLSHKGNKLGEGLFLFLRQADKFTVLQGSWAAYRSGYNAAIKAGKTSAEAKAAGIKNAEDITNRVQESSRLDTLSPLQRGGSYAKALTMLQSQPSKYSRIIWNVLRNIKYERGEKSTNIKRLLVLYFVVPTLYNAVAQQLTDEKYRDTPGEFATKTLLGPLTYPLIAGQIFQSLYGWATGSRFAYNASPILSIMDDMQKAMTQLGAGDIEEALTYFADVAGKAKGIPTPIVTRPLRAELKDSGNGGISYPSN